MTPQALLAMTPTITLGMSPIVVNLLVGLFLLVSIVMILIVLIQRPQGGGLGGAFGAGGGSGAGQTAFGTKTGDVLTGGTIAIFVCFLLLAIGLNFVTRPQSMDATQPTMSAPAEEQAGDEATDEGAGDIIDDETTEGAGEVIDETGSETGEIPAPETTADAPAADPAASEPETPATPPIGDN